MSKRAREPSRRQRDQSPDSEPTYTKKRWRPWRPNEGSTHPEEYSGEPVPYIINNDHAKADIIPVYDPEKNDIETAQWLNKIEQLAKIYD